MKLVSFRVRKFRNILDSTLVKVEPDITCLVGKNESGKTALQQALLALKPARPALSLAVHEHYPAWLEKKDRHRGIDVDAVCPIEATFALEDEERRAVAEVFGDRVLKSSKITVTRNYGGSVLYEAFDIDEAAALKHFLASVPLPNGFAGQARKTKDFESLRELAQSLSQPGQDGEEEGADDGEGLQAAETLKTRIAELLREGTLEDALWNLLEPHVPGFFYFYVYSTLPYSVKVKELLKADPTTLDADQMTALSLLRLAGADDEYLLNPDYERRKRELENVANTLTDDVLQYWTQNPELRVQPDITQKTEVGPDGQQTVLDEMKIRIWDDRHSLSLPFDQHSTGFQWFFSFLAAFSEYEHGGQPIIILLDEPALGLHARAQADFLRFIEERLVDRCQVIYTTHSPFMIQPGKLDRVRLVEDKGKADGAKVSEDILSTDRDTVFPLQGALGYDLAQHLFIAAHNLVVEGTSDFTYLTLVSDLLADQEGRESLDERWSVVPVGGADLIPTFVALLGHHLNVTVLVDAQKKGNQRLLHLAKKGYLAQKRIITIGQILDCAEADIEDLFSDEEYLRMYNKAFDTEVTPDELEGEDTIVKRIARSQSVDEFDHGKVADALLRNRDELLGQVGEETLQRFERLFKAINETLTVDAE